MPLFIIFRGGGKISDEERDYLDSLPNIRWAFQENAWADEHYHKVWTRFFCRTVQEHDPGNHLIFLDDLTCQNTFLCREIFIKNRVFPFRFPGGITEIVQPVDKGIGELTKRIMSLLYKTELEINYDAWRNYQDNKSLSASQRRMLMARWASLAWGYVKEQTHQIRRTFEDTVLITRNGQHRLQVPGHPNYSPDFDFSE